MGGGGAGWQIKDKAKQREAAQDKFDRRFLDLNRSLDAPSFTIYDDPNEITNQRSRLDGLVEDANSYSQNYKYTFDENPLAKAFNPNYKRPSRPTKEIEFDTLLRDQYVDRVNDLKNRYDETLSRRSSALSGLRDDINPIVNQAQDLAYTADDQLSQLGDQIDNVYGRAERFGSTSLTGQLDDARSTINEKLDRVSSEREQVSGRASDLFSSFRDESFFDKSRARNFGQSLFDDIRQEAEEVGADAALSTLDEFNQARTDKFADIARSEQEREATKRLEKARITGGPSSRLGGGVAAYPSARTNNAFGRSISGGNNSGRRRFASSSVFSDQLRS